METDAGRQDLVTLAVQMLATIDGKLDSLLTKEASLSDAECNKQNEFSVAAFPFNERLHAVLTSQET